MRKYNLLEARGKKKKLINHTGYRYINEGVQARAEDARHHHEYLT